MEIFQTLMSFPKTLCILMLVVSVFQGYQTYIIVHILSHFFPFMIGIHYMLH
jgi:hypothetical protein